MNPSHPSRHILMVKKRLANGEPCAKCAQAERVLRERGVWEGIDEVQWALEGDAESPGMKLGARLGVELAPFFVVTEGGAERVYTSALKFIKECFPAAQRVAPQVRLDSGPLDAGALSELADAPAEQVVKWALERFGAACAIAFSGAEDVVLIDLAAKTGLPFSVFCLDTGRLHVETYEYIEKVRERYSLEIELYSPEAGVVERLVRQKGLFSFYTDGHGECCEIRKLGPLRRALSKAQAWMTGQRRDQSPSTRGDLVAAGFDAVHQGVGDRLVKLNPLCAWTSQQVWDYIVSHDVPYNALHERGYVSIGCAPCTRATKPGEHERAGRWWWEEATQRECGLHVKKS